MNALIPKSSGTRVLPRQGLIVIPIVVGCAGSDGAPAGVTVRDSAGVEIVEHAGNLWTTEPKWTLAPEPALRVGAVDGDPAYLFDGITGIVQLSDGRFVVANSGDQTLRWFVGSGEAAFQRGGAGEGPGEFQRLSGISLIPGDSVMAVDWGNRRFTPFGPNGELGATIPIDGLTAPPGNAYRLASGEWIVGTGASTAQLGGAANPGIYRFDSPVLRLSADGSRVDTVGVFPSTEIEISGDGSSLTFRPATFGHRLIYAIVGEQIALGTGDDLRLEIITPAGVHVRSIRALDVSVDVTPEVADSYRNFLRGRLSEATPEQRAAGERRIAEMKLPPIMPAYSAMFADKNGNLWVGEYRPDARAPQLYLVFDRQGVFVTTVEVPPDVRVLAVSGDRIWARETDEMDVQYVVAYEIARESEQ